MKTATLIQATVKYAVDRIRKTKYGDKIKLVAARDDGGADIELWDRPETALHYLAKGEPLQILFDGERYTLLGVPEPTNGNGHQEPEAPAASPPLRPAAPTPETRETAIGLSADIKEWLQIYSELERARPDLQEATRRAAASTLFVKRCEIRAEFD